MAAGLGLSAADMGLDGFTAQRWSAGNPFTFVPVRGWTRSDAAASMSRASTKRSAAARTRRPSCSCARRGPGPFVPRAHVRAGHGVHEDPATGSAVAAFAGYLAARGGYTDGEHVIGIEQGYEMGLPARSSSR
jgi:trans-2,3-dihydro-3-hydroxyanthranilate isomerase